MRENGGCFGRLGLAAACAALCAFGAGARDIGFGIDAFNRVVPASSSSSSVFSPLSFEIDCVALAEAVDPIRRSQFTAALHVLDEFGPEYGLLARAPFERPATNGYGVAWAHLFVVPEPMRVNAAYRLSVQETYGVEIGGMARETGLNAWIRALFAGACDGWRLPALAAGDYYDLHDLVSVTAEAAPTNGWKRVCPTHTVYQVPFAGGARFYALVPKPGRPVSSVRPRLTSVTLPEILSMTSAVTDPPVPVALALPEMEIATTNDLAGAFSYFKLPTAPLRAFSPTMRPARLRQAARFRLRSPAVGAERLEGPFLFFVYDPAADAIPVIGIHVL